jgi:hypothetical protein
MAHTPGPWQVNYRRITPVNARQDGSDDICHVYGDDEVDMANARLIAASPELLEALKRIREDLVRQYSPYVYEVNFKYIDEAISKC